MIAENYRAERKSYKLDLALNGKYVLELFSFPDPPVRVSRPEAAGLRHLAFEVDDIEQAIETLRKENIIAEPARIDEFTQKRFTFFFLTRTNCRSNCMKDKKAPNRILKSNDLSLL